MNKALHAFVYLFLALAGAALWFELQLSAKRELLTDRNRLQEDYIVKLAKTVEKEDAPREEAVELRKDVSPVEAKIVDTPETENILEEYKVYLEKQNLETLNFDSKRDQLRMVYLTADGDPNGEPIMDGNRKKDSGPGTEREILEQLFDASSKQRARLDTTRAELTKLRGILEDTVDELNRLKPVARQDKVTIGEREERIAKLESEKGELDNQIAKLKARVDGLVAENTELRNDADQARAQVAEKDEELEEVRNQYNELNERMRKMRTVQSAGSAAAAGAASAGIPFGDKGKVIEVDNENMFAIVQFSEDALRELRGGKEGNAPITPGLELSVKRPGYNGEAGDFVGRIRIRQEIPEKPYLICDVLGAWSQTDMRAGDVVFAD
ncbi:MAG: hypothetical protein IJJ51_01480 [Kiritimatiellae bacterium]|nr:hypothetical protein [Kiritimatiellia bacterium]